jgi:molecular chaperone DnaJ
MERARDYYEVLGVPRNAGDREIRAAFRKLALEHHPDRSKEPDAEERFKEIAAAYAVLSDPEKRRDYDLRGAASVAGMAPEDLFAGLDLGDLLGGLGLGFEEDLFGGLLGRPRPRGPARGADLQVRLTVPLARIVTGGDERVQVTRRVACTACGGSGARAGTVREACADCGGSGERVDTQTEPGRLIRRVTTCRACHGRGTVVRDACPECHGVGTVARAEELTVKVPVGAEEGLALRVPGHGMAALEAGAPPGDLFVVVQTASDPRLVRDGPDLWREETIGVPDAVLGTSLRVPSLEGGETTLTVPAGTQAGTVLRLRGKGLPRFGPGPRGDMLVRVEVQVPEHPGDEERALYERLRAIAHGDGSKPGRSGGGRHRMRPRGPGGRGDDTPRPPDAPGGR